MYILGYKKSNFPTPWPVEGESLRVSSSDVSV